LRSVTFAIVAASAAAIAVAGCKGQENEGPAFVPKKYTFQGSIDKAYAGNWESVDKTSGLNMSPDGTVTIEVVGFSQKGKAVSHVKGQWRVNQGNLMLQYTGNNKVTTVLNYKATLKGSTLTVQPDGSRVKTIYRKK
jgi:hypothetical protein